jgi:outer membrane receptor protein involved in Fe transport
MTLRYLERGRSIGSAYLAWSASFKAPTLDQKYDRRRILLPFPPFELSTSNPGLAPQHGQTLEAGMTQWLAVGSGSAQVTASVYHTAMRDEIDFDVEELGYRNIGRSRHRGLEAGLLLEGGAASVQASYTLQDAIARAGDHRGKRLKAIPRHTAQAGLSVRPFRARAVEGSASVTHLAGMFFDDGNTRPIPDYTRVDARLAIGIARYTLLLDARNLLGARYSSTGFLDPAGSGEAYLYPAAERVIEIGLRSRW